MSASDLHIFVKTSNDTTATYCLPHCSTVRELQLLIHDREGVPLADQVLSYGGRRLSAEGCPLTLMGVSSGATVHCSAALRGGKPVKVKMLTPHLASGDEVTIDADEGAHMLDVKRQLEKATGVPLASQKVMLSGIGQLVMGDKRTNIKFGSCGTSNSINLAVQASDKQQ